MQVAPENQTVWFRVRGDNSMPIKCMIYDMTGWHCGWWSGSRFHSYHTDKTFDVDQVGAWHPLNIPGVEPWNSHKQKVLPWTPA